MLSNFTKNLKKLKDKSGMTAQEISEISGVPESTVSRIISGATDNPTFKNVCDIVIAMGGSLDELLGIEPVTKDETVYISRELIDSYKRHISDKQRWMRVFFIALCISIAFIMTVLIMDLIHGSYGYIRYN